MAHVTIAAVGDVITGFDPPENQFLHVKEALRSADWRFAQVEHGYSERGAYQEQSGGRQMRQHPRMAAAYKTVPFDVLSIASNTTGVWGPEAVEDTVETFRLLGIKTVGAGRNIAEARKSVILESKGIRVAFLAYVSVALPQTWATDSRAGSAPMRAHTFYEPYEFQPGAPARVVTLPHASDLDCLTRDVRQAKRDADVVLVSLHWGVHHVSRPCDYQPMVAHAAIDAGASAILGHHPHQPQGIEIYKKGVIFYSIGNCSIHRGSRKKGDPYCMPNMEYRQRDVYSVEPDPGFEFDFRRHYNEGGIVFLQVDSSGIVRATYMPTFMNEVGQPQVVHPEDPQFAKSLTYLNWTGKFIAGGVTQMKAVGNCFEAFARSTA
jgi:poly-gamma-glutamate capsule biosynthesis protein CapA/YwtB (metallophosphatase superfamily)